MSNSTDMSDDARKALCGIAAECHRAKWQFDLSEDYQPSKAAARAMIAKAFDELHRIGDIAFKAYKAVNQDNGGGTK